MRMHTPNGHTPNKGRSKSPFAINRKSQIGTSSSTPFKENQKSLSNRLQLDTKCVLAMSRPMIEVDGNLVDPEAELRDRENTILSYKNITKRLEFEIRRKDGALADLQNMLIQKEEHIMRLQHQKQQLSSMLNASQLIPVGLSQPTVSENIKLKRQLSQKSSQVFQAKAQIQKLKEDLMVFANIESKLRQMEQLQATLVAQNDRIKSHEDREFQMLRHIAKTLKTGGQVDYREIQKITGVII